MELSIRLQMNVDLVPEKCTVADIGCDHGYGAIYLAENKNCTRVIAMDVKQGPLDMAEKNISRAGLSDIIECRLSNGMEKLQPREVDTLMIAGMGGMLVCQILQGKPEVLSKIQTLVIQAQSDLKELRKLLPKLGFFIDKEAMCKDAGKYYLAIRALRGVEENPYTEAEYEFGRYLPAAKDSLYHTYVLQEKEKLEHIREQLKKKKTQKAEERIVEITHTLMEITQILEVYNGGTL